MEIDIHNFEKQFDQAFANLDRQQLSPRNRDLIRAYCQACLLRHVCGKVRLARVVITLSNAIADYWWLIGGVIAAAVFGIRRYHETQRGKRVIDSIALKMPIVGMLLRKIAVARFCRTLSTLTSSGVPILDGLMITAKTAGNSIVEDAILATRKSVEEGKTISEPLGDTDVFPSMVVQMIAVGEQTGALDTMLSKIADFYEEEVDTAVAGLMKLLEPVLIAFLGVAIGGIVIAMYMPMFTLIGQIG